MSPRIFLIACLCCFWGCATEDIIVPVDPGPTPLNTFVLKESTFCISEDTNQDILSFDPEGGMIVYQVGSPQLDSLEEGMIILSPPSTAAAGGYLRRITEIITSNDRMALMTEPANLPDAFSEYNLNVIGQSGGGRSEPTPPGFTFDVNSSTYNFTQVQPDGTELVIELTVFYDFDFACQLQYSLDIGIVQTRLGLERFHIDSITLEMSLQKNGVNSLRNGLDAFTVTPEVSQGGVDVRPITSIPLGAIPVSPPPAYFQLIPVVTIDNLERLELSAKVGAKFTLDFEDNQSFKALLTKEPSESEVRSQTSLQSIRDVGVQIFMNGRLYASEQLGIGIGLAPYTRGLLTVGGRISAGVYSDITGAASINLSHAPGEEQGDITVPAGFNAEAGMVARADIFVDGDFWGFAPDILDVNFKLFEQQWPFARYGLDNSCGYFFNNISVIVDPGGTTMDVIVDSRPAPNIDVSGKYEIYLDNELYLGGGSDGYNPNQSYEDLPISLDPGEHTVRLLRINPANSLPRLCERQVRVDVRGLGTSELCGVDQAVDVNSNKVYCIHEFDGVRWFGSNLFTFLPGPDGSLEPPLCPDGIDVLCEPFGGLYDYNQLLDVAPDVTPLGDNLQGLCPDNYHVPSLQEWLALFGASDLEPDANGNYLITGVATAFRAGSSWGQNDPQFVEVVPSGNDFNALAAGWYTNSSNSGFSNFGEETIWWTSTAQETELGEAGAYAVILKGTSTDVEIKPMPRTQGNSCRCVRDQ